MRGVGFAWPLAASGPVGSLHHRTARSCRGCNDSGGGVVVVVGSMDAADNAGRGRGAGPGRRAVVPRLAIEPFSPPTPGGRVVGRVSGCVSPFSRGGVSALTSEPRADVTATRHDGLHFRPRGADTVRCDLPSTISPRPSPARTTAVGGRSKRCSHGWVLRSRHTCGRDGSRIRTISPTKCFSAPSATSGPSAGMRTGSARGCSRSPTMRRETTDVAWHTSVDDPLKGVRHRPPRHRGRRDGSPARRLGQL